MRMENLRSFSALLPPQVVELSRRAAEHRAQSLLKELEEELAEMKKWSAALSQLMLSEDYVHFLKVDQSCSTLKFLLPARFPRQQVIFFFFFLPCRHFLG